MIDFSSLKKLTIGGVELKQLFINGIQVWKSGYKNWVKYSTEDDGVTIYNGGKGYMDGYRLSSSGSMKEQGHSTTIGYIPIKSGDVVRIGGYPWHSTTSALNYFVFYGADFGFLLARRSDNLSGATSLVKSVVIKGDVTEITLASNINAAYFRVNYYGANDKIYDVTGENLIVTINEEIS